MSVHLVPHTIVEEMLAAIEEAEFTTPVVGEPDANGMTPLTFTPDLTPQQEVRFEDVEASIKAGVPGLKAADLEAMTSYLNVASPTQAQTITALKATIRTLRATVKDVG
jgi:hypothetical protein